MKFDDTRDFPYYKHNPRISKKAWIVLLAALPLSYLFFSLFEQTSELLASLVFCLVLLIPLLYFSKWDYGLFIKRPSGNEILLGVMLFVGYMIYSIIFNIILESAGLMGAEMAGETSLITLESLVSLIVIVFAEELIKFIPLMFLLRAFYKYTDNRKLSIALSTAIVLISFGMLHYAPPYSTLASVLVLQGFGSIFELYGYLKTKNIMVPYISHLLTDAFIFTLIILGLAA